MQESWQAQLPHLLCCLCQYWWQRCGCQVARQQCRHPFRVHCHGLHHACLALRQTADARHPPAASNGVKTGGVGSDGVRRGRTGWVGVGGRGSGGGGGGATGQGSFGPTTMLSQQPHGVFGQAGWRMQHCPELHGVLIGVCGCHVVTNSVPASKGGAENASCHAACNNTTAILQASFVPR